MTQIAHSVKLRDGVHWVGHVDWNVRDFHGYTAHRGTTYNAYLIGDEKTALVDTVKAEYAEELLEKIAALADRAKVDYVISNHAEPDHAGALPRAMACRKGKSEHKPKPGRYRCARCGAVSKKKRHLCKPKRIPGTPP